MLTVLLPCYVYLKKNFFLHTQICDHYQAFAWPYARCKLKNSNSFQQKSALRNHTGKRRYQHPASWRFIYMAFSVALSHAAYILSVRARFYLPLAICAAVSSRPSISFSATVAFSLPHFALSFLHHAEYPFCALLHAPLAYAFTNNFFWLR